MVVFFKYFLGAQSPQVFVLKCVQVLSGLINQFENDVIIAFKTGELYVTRQTRLFNVNTL